MTREEKIKWLEGYKYSQIRIERKYQQLQQWREQVKKAGTTISDMPKGGGHFNKVEDLTVKIVDRENEITRELTEQIQLQREIEEAICTVENEAYRELLLCRYIDCMTFEKIATKLSYSYEWVMKNQGLALDKLKIKQSVQ